MKRLAASLCLLLGACSSSAGPESSPPPAMAPADAGASFLSSPPAANGGLDLPKPGDAVPTVLIAGDVIRVTVFRQPDLDLETRIPSEGTVSYPLIGELQAAGRTPSAVEKEIRDRLGAKFVYNPSVNLTVKEFSPRMVYVLGGIQKPGSYEFLPARRLTVLQLISTSGGFTDRAYKEYSQLVRRKPNGERETFRFSVAEVERAVAKGKVEADVELMPDDLLIIPSASRVVYVLGQVHRPGSIEMPADTRLTVSMAISAAGSWTKYGSIGRIQVLRQPPTGEPVKFLVDLDAIVNGRPELDVEIQPGDVIWVPQRGLF